MTTLFKSDHEWLRIEGDVATIMFRDGTRRAIQSRDVITGASIAKIARVALDSGARVSLWDASETALRSAAAALAVRPRIPAQPARSSR